MTAMQRTAAGAVALAALLLASCSDQGDDIVGQWQSTEAYLGQRNALTAGENGDGTATLYVIVTEQGQTLAGRFEFDARWSPTGSDGEFELDMSCTRSPYGDCAPEDDFEMVCALDGESALGCQAEGINWESYVFEWTRL